LADHLSKAKQDNEQLNRELTDANNMLVELRKELDRWRANVLGFRQEMREAQQTQLEALAKIMKMLGGEMALPPSSGPAAGAAQPRSNAAAEPASRPSESGAPQP
jgi:septal ring factor EnvC (AmiA/AmiB activator)